MFQQDESATKKKTTISTKIKYKAILFIAHVHCISFYLFNICFFSVGCIYLRVVARVMFYCENRFVFFLCIQFILIWIWCNLHRVPYVLYVFFYWLLSSLSQNLNDSHKWDNNVNAIPNTQLDCSVWTSRSISTVSLTVRTRCSKLHTHSKLVHTASPLLSKRERHSYENNATQLIHTQMREWSEAAAVVYAMRLACSGA